MLIMSIGLMSHNECLPALWRCTVLGLTDRTGSDLKQGLEWSAEVAWSVMAVGRIGTVVTRCREAVDPKSTFYDHSLFPLHIRRFSNKE